MNPVAAVMAVFSVLGALDRIFGNRIGLGKEFERAVNMAGVLALSMIGMIVLSPLIANLLSPVSRITISNKSAREALSLYVSMRSIIAQKFLSFVAER